MERMCGDNQGRLGEESNRRSDETTRMNAGASSEV
jgi:hypothetical protein